MALSDSQASADILYGSEPSVITLKEAVTKGDAVGYYNGWRKALATSSTVYQMRCVASEDGVANQDITAYFGIVLMGGRLSGGTAEAALYVAEGSDAGKYTETAPTTTGDANKKVGIMITDSVAILFPNVNDDSVA